MERDLDFVASRRCAGYQAYRFPMSGMYPIFFNGLLLAPKRVGNRSAAHFNASQAKPVETTTEFPHWLCDRKKFVEWTMASTSSLSTSLSMRDNNAVVIDGNTTDPSSTEHSAPNPHADLESPSIASSVAFSAPSFGPGTQSFVSSSSSSSSEQVYSITEKVSRNKVEGEIKQECHVATVPSSIQSERERERERGGRERVMQRGNPSVSHTHTHILTLIDSIMSLLGLYCIHSTLSMHQTQNLHYSG